MSSELMIFTIANEISSEITAREYNKLSTRILKRKEYNLLGEEKEKLFLSFPKDSKIIVTEQDGQIVGHWALIPYWHVECFEVYESHHKKAGVARGLLRTMFGILRSMGIKTVWTASISSEVDSYLSRMKAIELPGKHFVLPVGE